MDRQGNHQYTNMQDQDLVEDAEHWLDEDYVPQFDGRHVQTVNTANTSSVHQANVHQASQHGHQQNWNTANQVQKPAQRLQAVLHQSRPVRNPMATAHVYGIQPIARFVQRPVPNPMQRRPMYIGRDGRVVEQRPTAPAVFSQQQQQQHQPIAQNRPIVLRLVENRARPTSSGAIGSVPQRFALPKPPATDPSLVQQAKKVAEVFMVAGEAFDQLEKLTMELEAPEEPSNTTVAKRANTTVEEEQDRISESLGEFSERLDAVGDRVHGRRKIRRINWRQQEDKNDLKGRYSNI